MKEIYIIGASGFGREIAWLIEELEEWSVKGFIDDNESLLNSTINDIPVVGGVSFLNTFDEEINVVIAISNPFIRKKIVDLLALNNKINYPNILSKDIKLSKFIKLGKGNIICKGSILTTNIEIGDFNHINLNCTIGHDISISNYITAYPSVNISGNVTINCYCELGTGTKIIQGNSICKNVVTGAGAVVLKDISEEGTYVGVPCKKIKK